MGERRVAFVVVGEAVTVVMAEMPDDSAKPVTVLGDETWKLQNGEKASSYAVLHQRCHDYLRENKIQSVVIKSSALTLGAVKLGLLHSAEVRGVIIAASASVCEVRLLSKAVISRTYGERKVDEYLQDDEFWSENTQGGNLRKTSREAAMLLVASRED